MGFRLTAASEGSLVREVRQGQSQVTTWSLVAQQAFHQKLQKQEARNEEDGLSGCDDPQLSV
jgi:hypothetical protein